MIYVIGPRDRGKYPDLLHINTTSSSKTWSKGLSPFFLGPVTLYQGMSARNVENAWQYCKTYKEHLNPDGSIKDAYWSWAKAGWADDYARRYPMGKGVIPEFSLWDGQRLDYVNARKQIYLPLYATAVRSTEGFRRLENLYQQHGKLVLFDFDGYDYVGLGMTLEEVLNDPTRKMGHAFVLAMLLLGKI